MIKRKISKLIQVDSLKKYVKYGLGEIVLLVAGILIALQINNWNENRKAKNELQSILSTVQSDLNLDLTEADLLIKQYEFRIQLLDSAFNKLDGKLPENFPSSIGINTSYQALVLNVRGFDLLKSYKSQNSISSDSLIISINDFYNNVSNNNKLVSDLLNGSVEETIEYYRDNFYWYEQFMKAEISNEMIRDVYSNLVTRNHALHYKMIAERNYLPMLKSFVESGKILSERIEKQL